MEITYNQINTKILPCQLDHSNLANSFTPRKFACQITPKHKNIDYLINTNYTVIDTAANRRGRPVKRTTGG